MDHEPPDSPPPGLFSEILTGLGERAEARLTLATLIDAFEARAFGAGLTIIAVISLLPWPPGSKVVFSLPLALIATEVVLQRRKLWLPRWLLDMSLSRVRYAAGLKRLIGPIRRIEALSRPRLTGLTVGWMRSVIGLACLFLTVMLALPIPFGDVMPALTIIVLGFALMQRDGLAALVGLAGTVICFAYLVFVWEAVMHLFAVAVAWVLARAT